MNELEIKSNIKNYVVKFEDNFDFVKTLSEKKSKVLIIDKNVFEIYKSIFSCFDLEDVVMFDAIEENKTIDYALSIIKEITKKSAKKNLTIISAGGGVTQDVTGFIASILYRGVNWIFIPTTFLAQTDSCIGSKTSINFESFKNLLGTFYPPSEIYINTNFLKSLSELDFYNGIGETIKFKLMKEEDAKSFESIVHEIEFAKSNRDCLLPLIVDNMKVKLSYMAGDEFDQGRRNMLNYGHCFGHAIESVSNYEVPHGIAVAIGIVFANTISKNRKLIDNSLWSFLNEALLIPNIPLKLNASYFDTAKLLGAMKSDKKRIGSLLTAIIPSNGFEMIKIDDLNEEEFMLNLDETRKILLRSES